MRNGKSKRRLFFWLALAAVSFAPVGRICFGFGMPPSKPLAQAIKDADVIVEATIVSETTDPNYQPPNASDRGKKGLIYWNTISKPGRYEFSSQHIVKGSCPEKFTVDMPLVLSLYYGDAKFKIEQGQSVLLILRNGEKGLAPVDPTVPLIPLAASARIPEGADQLVSTVGLLVSSLEDDSLRQAYTFLLRSTVDRSVVVGLAKYLDDTNPKVLDNVLFAMATNQQLEAIPRIRTFAERHSGEGIGVQCPMALKSYTVPEAVTSLNPLLFSSDYYVRLHAMDVLDKLADKTSIPYLILAMRDPDGDHIVDQSAYGNLHRLIPSLGPGSGEDFNKHRDQEQQKILAWWADELSGKHGSTEPAIVPTPKDDSILLFAPVAKTREEAIARMAKSPDKDNIPYLILSLQDPDPAVGFAAIIALGHAVPELKAPRLLEDFEQKNAEYVGPVYIWWQKRLSDGSQGK